MWWPQQTIELLQRRQNRELRPKGEKENTWIVVLAPQNGAVQLLADVLTMRLIIEFPNLVGDLGRDVQHEHWQHSGGHTPFAKQHQEDPHRVQLLLQIKRQQTHDAFDLFHQGRLGEHREWHLAGTCEFSQLHTERDKKKQGLSSTKERNPQRHLLLRAEPSLLVRNAVLLQVSRLESAPQNAVAATRNTIHCPHPGSAKREVPIAKYKNSPS